MIPFMPLNVSKANNILQTISFFKKKGKPLTIPILNKSFQCLWARERKGKEASVVLAAVREVNPPSSKVSDQGLDDLPSKDSFTVLLLFP